MSVLADNPLSGTSGVAQESERPRRWALIDERGGEVPAARQYDDIVAGNSRYVPTCVQIDVWSRMDGPPSSVFFLTPERARELAAELNAAADKVLA